MPRSRELPPRRNVESAPPSGRAVDNDAALARLRQHNQMHDASRTWAPAINVRPEHFQRPLADLPDLPDLFQRHRPVMRELAIPTGPGQLTMRQMPGALQCLQCGTSWPCDAAELLEQLVQERCRALRHHQRHGTYHTTEEGDAYQRFCSPEERGQLRLRALLELGLVGVGVRHEFVPATATMYMPPEQRAQVVAGLREHAWQSGVRMEGIDPAVHPTERRCANCGHPPGRHGLRHGRCAVCNMHWRRHGTERPTARQELIDGNNGPTPRTSRPADFATLVREAATAGQVDHARIARRGGNR